MHPHPRCFTFLLASLALLATPAAGAVVARLEIPQAAQPQLAVAADGDVWLAYGHAGDVFVARSRDGGTTFSPAIKAASHAKLMLGMRRGPRIAARGSHVTVTFIADELQSVHSGDGGVTWSRPRTVNDVPNSAREGLHDLAISPEGRLFVTWLDLRRGTMELWSAESANGGETWAAHQEVYRSPDTTICECCHPTALFDADGNLAVMWRNAIQGTRDMWLTTRPKGATRFTEAKKLGQGSWTLNACPMDGGRIIAEGGGKFSAVWQRAGEIFQASTGEKEVSLGHGKQAIALLGGRDAVFFWQQGNDLVTTRRPGGGAPSVVAKDARFAVAAPSTQSGIVLAYESGPPKATAVVVEVLR